jgi:hypothetical protein
VRSSAWTLRISAQNAEISHLRGYGQSSSRLPFQIRNSYLGLEWHGQVQPGRLQSPCLVSYVEFSLQKDEIIGGQTPSAYPGKELSVGSGVVSG